MDRIAFQELVEKYQQGTCTPEEEIQLLSWYNVYMKSQPSGTVPEGYHAIKQQTWLKIQSELTTKKAKNIGLYPRLARYAAAAILLLSLTFAYVRFFQTTPQPVYTESDFLPGGKRATLQLASGERITLDETQGVILINEDGISYNGDHSAIAQLKDVQQLKLQTPKGGTYRVILPDGSQVWLNANTTLYYPSQFSDSIRSVELEGEAYFAIAKAERKGAKIPFIVKSKGQLVEVLGTEFNISAYPEDQENRTSLVEGSIRLSLPQNRNLSRENSMLLRPGEQAVNSNGTLHKTQVELARFTSWKDGIFYFRDADIDEVAKQLERWYDVEVVYQGAKTKKQFTGEIPRDSNASEILTMLEFFGLQYHIEGRRIILSNNQNQE